MDSREHMDRRIVRVDKQILQRQRSATIAKHKNKWKLWASKVKIIAASIMSKKRSDATEDRDNGNESKEERMHSTTLGWKTYWVLLEGSSNRTEGYERGIL
jgi:hypothetical protein